MIEVPTSAGTTVNVLETDIANPVVGAQEKATVHQQNALFLRLIMLEVPTSAGTTVNVLETDIANQVVGAQEQVTVQQQYQNQLQNQQNQQ
jgi:hypothetical protein